jgi:hypothetical protein
MALPAVPVAPIPVTPIAWPEMPASMMPLARQGGRGRPGIVTAMGIISIIVACMSGVTSLVVTFFAFVMMVASQNAPAVRTPPAPPQVVNANIPGGSKATAVVAGIPIDPAQSEDGIDEDARGVVMMGMTRARAIDEPRQKQLDLLLAVAGRSIFPFVSGTTTPQTIRANVSESGRLPSASGRDGPDYFIVGTGRVEVYDEHAIFRPDGSPNVVSVMAPPDPTDDGKRDADPDAVPVPRAPGLRAPATSAPPMPAPTPIPNPISSIHPTASTLSMVEGLLSMALALYLFIIGIVTLRSTRRGWKLHWLYVALKIPLVALFVVASFWMARGFAAGLNATAAAVATNTPGGAGGPPAMTSAKFTAVTTTWIVLLACAALAYPVSLLFVLLSRTVREYYRPMRD